MARTNIEDKLTWFKRVIKLVNDEWNVKIYSNQSPWCWNGVSNVMHLLLSATHKQLILLNIYKESGSKNLVVTKHQTRERLWSKSI